MIRALAAAVILLSASSVLAQSYDPEAGLTEGHLIGEAEPVAPAVLRPQLVQHDRTTVPVVGGIAAVTGGVALVGAWSLYVARANYRLTYRSTLSNDVVDEWTSMGAWSLWMGVFASASLVASEYLLLPEASEVPWYAWLGGAVGLGVAAVGVGFAVGGSHCGPVAIRPGADLQLACSAGTADAEFGPLLMLTALPLVNLPVTYLLRRLFAGAPESLSFTGHGVALRGVF